MALDAINLSLCNICRLCLASEGTMLNIYNNNRKYNLSLEIQSLACLQALPDDGLPNLICNNCLINIEFFISFREQILTSYRQLTEFVIADTGQDKVLETTLIPADCDLLNSDRITDNIQAKDGAHYITENRSPLDLYSDILIKDNFPTNSVDGGDLFRVEIIPENHIDEILEHSITGLAHSESHPDLTSFHDDVVVENVLLESNITLNKTQDDLDFNDNENSQIASNKLAFKKNLKDLEKLIDLNHQDECVPRITEIHLTTITNTNGELAPALTTDKTYLCHLCLTEFPSDCMDTLLAHSNEHFDSKGICQNEPEFKCELCATTFVSRYKFIIHQRLHMKIKPFKSEKCKHSFTSLELLRQHDTKLINNCLTLNRMFECDVCGKVFKRKADLKYHCFSHFPKGKYLQCDECQKKYSNERTLMLHKRTHVKGKQYKCSKCDKPFYLRGELLRHEQSHTTRKFPCTVCDKAFMSTGELKRHMLYHDKVKKFKCDFCQKSFFESCHLSKHLKSRHPKDPYLCVTCGQKYPNKMHLKNHLKVHSDSPPSAKEQKSKLDREKKISSKKLMNCLKALVDVGVERVGECEEADDIIIIVVEANGNSLGNDDVILYKLNGDDGSEVRNGHS